jgi:hypothetical protein
MHIGRMPQFLLQRLAALVLVACSFACCCPERSLTALFAADDAPTEARCCGGCCGGNDAAPGVDGGRTEPSDTDGERVPHDGRCLGDCCNKADFKAPPFKVACDEVGAPLPEPLLSPDAVAAEPTVAAFRVDDDIGEPPPWRLLIVSARLRI